MFKYSSRPQLKVIVFVKNNKIKTSLLKGGALPSSMQLLELEEPEQTNMAKAVFTENLKDALAERNLYAENGLFLATTPLEIEVAKGILMANLGVADEERNMGILWGTPTVIEDVDLLDDRLLLRVFWRFHDIPWVIAETKRCLIRELALEDLPELMDLYDREGISYCIDENGEKTTGFVEPLFAYEEEWEYQKNYIKHMYHCFEFGMWLILDKESQTLIGRAGLETREFENGVEMELGYLIHPNWQRKGIATEVCMEIIAYAREFLNCEKLNLLVEKENIPSLALAKKCGFVFLENMLLKGTQMQRYVLHLDGK